MLEYEECLHKTKRSVIDKIWAVCTAKLSSVFGTVGFEPKNLKMQLYFFCNPWWLVHHQLFYHCNIYFLRLNVNGLSTSVSVSNLWYVSIQTFTLSHWEQRKLDFLYILIFHYRCFRHAVWVYKLYMLLIKWHVLYSFLMHCKQLSC